MYITNTLSHIFSEYRSFCSIVVLRIESFLRYRLLLSTNSHKNAGLQPHVRWTHGLYTIMTNAQSSCPEQNPLQSSNDARLVDQSNPHAAPGSAKAGTLGF